MCHIRIKGFLRAVLTFLLVGHIGNAEAQTTGNIEQRLAGSLAAMPTENLSVSGRILCTGLFERLDEPGQAAGGLFGHAQHP